jgi:phosphinothricin acetyltransferase
LTYFLAPEHTRKGIGGMILATLIREACQQGIDRVLASISSLNPDSLAFHAKKGFEEVGRLNGIGRKFDRDFDVVYMQRILAIGD